MGNWAKRPAAEILNYRRQLHIRDTRMENVIINPDPAKVRQAVPIVHPFASAAAVKRYAREVRKNGGRVHER